jgi:hypothetical protein
VKSSKPAAESPRDLHHSRQSKTGNVDPRTVRADRICESGQKQPDPQYPRSSSQLVTTLASAVVQNLAAGASRHAIAKAMLLGPLADIWLVRALHLFSESYEAKADAHPGIQCRSCRRRTHAPSLKEDLPMLRPRVDAFQHLARFNRITRPPKFRGYSSSFASKFNELSGYPHPVGAR